MTGRMEVSVSQMRAEPPIWQAVVDGYVYEGRVSSATKALHFHGPLSFRRPTRGYIPSDGEWTDDSGPQGKLTQRHRRWWAAALAVQDHWEDWLLSSEVASR